MSALWKKLNLKDQREIVVLDAPGTFDAALGELSGVTVKSAWRGRTAPGFVLAFTTKKAGIERVAKLVAKGDGDVIVWVAYPKKTSRRFTCDFDRDAGWEPLGEAGFESVRIVAIDEDWSALRFRRVEHIATLRRDPKRALTAKGRAAAQRRKA